MKKVFVSICVAGAALAMSSCRSVEKAVPVSSINGERSEERRVGQWLESCSGRK